jgi:hypothetical protein
MQPGKVFLSADHFTKHLRFYHPDKDPRLSEIMLGMARDKLLPLVEGKLKRLKEMIMGLHQNNGQSYPHCGGLNRLEHLIALVKSWPESINIIEWSVVWTRLL